ncbi:MAG: hypothetical protein ACTHPO_09565 [Alphaproteobacteria bacterium]|mgnify:CR=1 FL=1|jgi:hypothetical protein|nr:hypothetical protein [Alphaproteobacteria bacterium]|tara:strand:- start:2367 stop:2693 length:327 start_codon:yes stop_codon:yes gene_type:complete
MKNLLSQTFVAVGLSTTLSACDIYHRPASSTKCYFDQEKQEIRVMPALQEKVHRIALSGISNDDVVSGVSKDGVRVVFNKKQNKCYGHSAEMSENLSLKYDYSVVPKF